MPRKKIRNWKRKGPNLPTLTVQHDFTINECANAEILTNRIRKPHLINSLTLNNSDFTRDHIAVNTDFTLDQIADNTDLTWDQIADDEGEVTINKNEIGLMQSQTDPNKNESIVKFKLNYYPEIVWYLISNYIKPEGVCTFALINKQTYAITKTESFWRKLYMRYCKKKDVPEKLRLENDHKVYGLQQRVVRALYHSYNLFKQSIFLSSAYSIGQDKRPYELIRRRCISMWYKKEESHWSVYFKLKKYGPDHRINESRNFLQEMDRIDANDEEGCKVLEVTCATVNVTEPIFGMTLSTVNISLSHNFTKHKLQLGFTSSHHNVCKEILPECVIEINEVTGVTVMDWWHPYYPHTDRSIPPIGEEAQVLDRDFFS